MKLQQQQKQQQQQQQQEQQKLLGNGAGAQGATDGGPKARIEAKGEEPLPVSSKQLLSLNSGTRSRRLSFVTKDVRGGAQGRL